MGTVQRTVISILGGIIGGYLAAFLVALFRPPPPTAQLVGLVGILVFPIVIWRVTGGKPEADMNQSISEDELSRFARQVNIPVLIQDVIAFGLCFMSWGAVFGIGGGPLDMGMFGALIGVNVWFWLRRRNIGGVKTISTVGGMGAFFAIVGVIVWIVKAII